MTSALDGARLLDAGETALVIEYGQTVAMDIHDRVMSLDAAIIAANWDGVRETVPTYRSLMVHYEPLVLPRETLINQLQALTPVAWQQSVKNWIMPVCFDPEIADDLHDAADRLALTAERVEELLLASHFRLYMYGFAPGFAYLGGLDPQLSLPRRKTPRPLMPASSVIIAGGLAAIGAVAMPTGWYVVAITPVPMFDKDRAGFVPFAVGDSLRFEAVDRQQFEILKERGQAGELIWREGA